MNTHEDRLDAFQSLKNVSIRHVLGSFDPTSGLQAGCGVPLVPLVLRDMGVGA